MAVNPNIRRVHNLGGFEMALSPFQYLFEPLALEIPLQEGFQEADWISLANEITDIQRLIIQGDATGEDILDALVYFGGVDVDAFIAEAEPEIERRFEILIAKS